MEEKLIEAEAQASLYVGALYALLPHLDLSTPDQRSKAHGILNMISDIQKMHALLKNPNTAHQERKDAFGTFFEDFYSKKGQ